MGKTRCLFGTLLLCVCVFFVSLAALTRAEDASPESALEKRKPLGGLDHPDQAALKHRAIIPLSSYTTEKGKALAQRHSTQLAQIVTAI